MKTCNGMLTQLTFTCWKSTIETLQKRVKHISQGLIGGTKVCTKTQNKAFRHNMIPSYL